MLPSLEHVGDLYLDYPLDDPSFYRSYVEQRHYKHYVFGLLVTLALFAAYLVKVCCLMPATKNRGQIAAHIFALKCGGLALYPTYGEFLSYCYGFMAADFPWLNSQFERVAGRQYDLIPKPHAMYYANLSLFSTYSLALIVAGSLWLGAAVYGYLRPDLHLRIGSFKSFLYNFFVMGAVIAGCLSLEGSLLNPLQSFTLVSISYVAGIFVYVGLFVELVYSIATKNASDRLSPVAARAEGAGERGLADNFHKLRVFCKGTLLALLHLNPLYFFIALFCTELSAVSIDYFLRRREKQCPKVEAAQQIIVNVALGMVLCVPDSLLGLLLVSFLVLVVMGIDVFLNYKEYKELATIDNL